MDATANPHIAVAAVIAAGLLGVDGAMALPPPLQTDPADLTPAERTALGAIPLPASAAAAAGDTVIRKLRIVILGFGTW